MIVLILAGALTSYAGGLPNGKIPLKNLSVIVIDPGHGGENLGTRSIFGIQEKHVTLQIAKTVVALLKARTTATVLLTRNDDKPLTLAERMAFANKHKAAIFLSLHCNAEPKRQAHGIETYFLSATASDKQALKLAQRENGAETLDSIQLTTQNDVHAMLKQLVHAKAHRKSFDLAKSLLNGLLKQTGSKSRGVKQAPFGVLKGALMPAVVVEFGFLSHLSEAKKLLDPIFQHRLAVGLLKGIVAFDKSL